MNEIITYPCHGFSDDLPKGRASGHLAVHKTTIECTIAGHHCRMPLEGLQIRPGGASDRLVFLTHQSLPGWSFYTSDRGILKNAFLRRQEPLTQSLRQVRSVRLFNRAVLALTLIIIVALPLIFFTRVDNITKIIARQIPIEWEQQLGKTAYEQFGANAQQMDAKVTAGLLQPMTIYLEQTLTDNPYYFTFTIINNAELNAFALPGGYIVIHSGLVLEAESAEELLGVLAHEIAHVIEQHGLRKMITSVGTFAMVAALFGDINGVSGTIAAAAPLLINQSYSRDFEREADSVGHNLLVNANIDPRGLASFFEKIRAREKLVFNGVEDENNRDAVINSTALLRSHPATGERIKNLQQMGLNRTGDFRDLSLEFNRLQMAVRQFITGNTVEETHNGSRN